ncbi:OmpW family outer membrane protein [Paucibacter sp. APW11]|uniref:OmpW family outer membrane protein n=1 Tax=Roseateles aquae TaxID=3077235 RepID=A0ABU3PAS1_9BURK|nr:OmpW family outer membrane protein [Paucibacter sp. APW11]MDT8999644.1 OmpW family outer membrane protein [Paucibacter sp. APW11]
MNKLSCIAGLLLAGLAGASAAQTAHTFYLGAAHINVRANATPLTNSSVPDARLTVGDQDTVGFGYSYRFAAAWSAELALGLPPAHKVYGAGALEPFGQISVVEQMPPSVFLNYHFENVLPKFSPFVGLGINYTRFSKTRSTLSGNLASGGPTDISLKDSWGLAGHIGATVQFSKNWSLVTTIAMAHVRSDMTAVTHIGETTVTRGSDINFRPIVTTLSLGYSF